jgi:hypothetical protein
MNDEFRRRVGGGWGGVVRTAKCPIDNRNKQLWPVFRQVGKCCGTGVGRRRKLSQGFHCRDVVYRVVIVSYLIDVNCADRGSGRLSASFVLMHGGRLGLGVAVNNIMETLPTVRSVREAKMTRPHCRSAMVRKPWRVYSIVLQELLHPLILL